MTPNSKHWFIENFNLLKPLSSQEKEEISCHSSMQYLNKGQVIYLPEDEERTVYFLKKGKVKISKSDSNGRELIIYLLSQGEIFGELALAEKGKRDEKAEVMEEAIICGITVRDLEPILTKNPKLNLSITKLIGLRLKKIEHRLECLYFKNGDQRIKDFVLELADNYGRKIGLGFETEVKLHLTHSDIAKLTATSRQAVSTLLSRLEKANTISYNRKRILIKDYDALKD